MDNSIRCPNCHSYKYLWLWTLIVLVLPLLVTACGSSQKLEDRVVGQWVASLGPVIGLGDVSETMEFFKDGTVTARTKVTNFVGNYKFINDNTLRIDWKEQGLFGNSPTDIFRIRFDGDTLIMINDATKKLIEYQHPDIMTKTLEALPNMLPDLIVGKWRYGGETHYGEFEFNKDGTINATSDVRPDIGTTATGTYTIRDDGYGIMLRIEIQSPGVWPMWTGETYKVLGISKEKLRLQSIKGQDNYPMDFVRK